MNELEKKLTELELQRQFVFIETFIDGELRGKFSTSFFSWGYNEEGYYSLWIANNSIIAEASEISIDLCRNIITVNYQCVKSQRDKKELLLRDN